MSPSMARSNVLEEPQHFDLEVETDLKSRLDSGINKMSELDNLENLSQNCYENKVEIVLQIAIDMEMDGIETDNEIYHRMSKMSKMSDSGKFEAFHQSDFETVGEVEPETEDDCEMSDLESLSDSEFEEFSAVSCNKFIPADIDVPEGATAALIELEFVDAGKVESEYLGRMVRLSPRIRRDLSDCIVLFSGIGIEKPHEAAMCFGITQKCGRILALADSILGGDRFPFIKLPFEIREMIYSYYVGQQDKVVYRSSPCSFHLNEEILKERNGRPVEMALTQTCQQIHRELMPHFYRQCQYSFGCCCSFAQFLKLRQPLALPNLRSVSLSLWGCDRLLAIQGLSELKRLKSLTIVVGPQTISPLTGVSEKERLLREFSLSDNKRIRLGDALGMDELLNLRGIEEVHVRGQDSRFVTYTDKFNLERLLESKLRLPRQVA